MTVDDFENLTMEERKEIQADVEEAQAANELLNNPLVFRFFKDQVDDVFNSFCQLKLDCTLDEYRALHMRLIAMNELRLSLEAKRKKGEAAESRLRIIKQRDEDDDF